MQLDPQLLRFAVVDDDSVDVDILARILGKAGLGHHDLIAIDPSGGAVATAEKLAQEEVDLCFLDHRLGSWVGVDLLDADPSLPRRLPVVAFTVYDDDATAERVLQAGAVDFLDKNDLTPALIRRTVRYALHLHRTIRELRENRAAVLRNERKAILGSLAGGIAHEFNNLHAVILGNTELMSRRAQDDQSQRYLEAVRGSLERAGDIIAGMRRLAKEEASGSCDLASIWRSALALTRSDIESAAVTMVFEAPPVVPVAIDSGALMQVLLHLLSNAIDALRGAGHRLLTCEFIAGQEFATIMIEDTGVGIEPDDLPMVTKPFFSRKGANDRNGQFLAYTGGGSGLGLSVCERLIEEVGGTLQISSTKGQGTSVTVRIPVAEVGENSQPRLGTKRIDKKEIEDLHMRVLVVDDEPLIREVVATWAEDVGCQVESADQLQDLVHLVRDWRPHVLVLDWVMPHIDGRQVIALLRSRRRLANMHLVVYSGSPPPEHELADLGFASCTVLRKPAQGEVLKQTLSSIARNVAIEQEK